MRNDEAEKVAETQEDAAFLAAIVGDGVLLPVFIVGLLRARRLLDHLESPLVLLPARQR
jgi:hypothetical protein